MRYITLTQILPSPIITQYNKVSTLPLPLVPYIICGLPLAWFSLLPDCDILLSFHVPYVRTERYCSFVSRAFKHRHTTRPQATCNEYLMKFGDLVLEIWFWGYFLFICCALSLPGGFRVLADASICTPVYLFAYSFLTNPASWLPEPIKVLLASFTLYACRGCNQESPSRLALVFRFYRAMLCIRGTIAMGLCPSVCHKSVFCRNGWTNRAGFGMWVSFHTSYTVLKGNSVISKSKGTSLWNFVLNSGLRKFRHGISIVATCYQLSSRKVDAHSVINWTVVGQLSW